VAFAGLLTAAFVFGGAAPDAAPAAPGAGMVVPPDPVTSYTPQRTVGLGGPTVLNAPVVGMAPAGPGYLLASSDGGVFAYRGAVFHGSLLGSPGNLGLIPVVGMAATPDGGGYWLVERFGEVHAFGDARPFGSVSQNIVLNAAIVGMAATPDGGGYWLVSSDGGIFAFGDAQFYGSEGATTLNDPVVGMAATPDGGGYWLVASDGGVFAFGDARFYGSEGAAVLNSPVVGIASSGHAYWLAAGDGGVFAFGDAPFYGSGASSPPPHPVVAIASIDPGGYSLATSVTGPSPVPSQPQVDTCGTPQIQPATIVLACADHNSLLQSLRWSSWTPTRAQASGSYVYNTCVPFCAAGTFVTVPGTVTLDEPVSTSAGVEFSRATWTYPGPSGRPVTFSEGLFLDA
jgi:hypothetical protein